MQLQTTDYWEWSLTWASSQAVPGHYLRRSKFAEDRVALRTNRKDNCNSCAWAHILQETKHGLKVTRVFKKIVQQEKRKITKFLKVQLNNFVFSNAYSKLNLFSWLLFISWRFFACVLNKNAIYPEGKMTFQFL